MDEQRPAMLTVSALGSCRVHTPVRLLAKDRIKTDHDGAEWYTHSTRDALQKLKIVRAELTVPDAIVPLVAETHDKKWHPEKHRPNFYGKTDVFVVEICSRKVFSHEEFYYQQWPAQAVLREPERHPDLAPFMAAATQRVQTPEEVLEDLDRLCGLLARPVVLVPHIDVKTTDGRVLPERKVIHDLLEEFCRTRPDATFFDPTPVVIAFGEKAALIDSGHYREEFYPALADKLLEAVEAAASASAATAA